MLMYEYITLSVEVASVVEPKVHLASIPGTVPGLGLQEREPLVPSTTLVVPLGLITGSSKTIIDNERRLMSNTKNHGRQVHLLISLKRMSSCFIPVVQPIIVSAVLLNTSRGTGIISVYCVSLPLGGSIVTPEVELVSGAGLTPEPATKMVKVSSSHRRQVEMS